MKVQCNGRHFLLLLVRPVALTLCDAIALRRRSKACSACLLIFSGLLLFGCYLLTQQLDNVIEEAVKSAVTNRLLRAVGGVAAKCLVDLFLSNCAFTIFRAMLRGVLNGLHELGRDLVYALLILKLLLVITLAAWLGSVNSGSLRDLAVGNPGLATTLISIATVSTWYWARYISTRRVRHVFDHDIGAAMARLKYS